MKMYKEFKHSDNYHIFLNWVHKRTQGGKLQINNRISTDIRKEIFDAIWNEDSKYDQLTQKESEIFIEFFKSLNVIEGNIKRINVIMKIFQFQLHGLDKIWKAFQTVKNDHIAETLAELIAEIYMCPAK